MYKDCEYYRIVKEAVIAHSLSCYVQGLWVLQNCEGSYNSSYIVLLLLTMCVCSRAMWRCGSRQTQPCCPTTSCTKSTVRLGYPRASSTLCPHMARTSGTRWSHHPTSQASTLPAASGKCKKLYLQSKVDYSAQCKSQKGGIYCDPLNSLWQINNYLTVIVDGIGMLKHIYKYHLAHFMKGCGHIN